MTPLHNWPAYFSKHRHELIVVGVVIIVVCVYVGIKLLFPTEVVRNALLTLGAWAPIIYVLLFLAVNILLPTLAPPLVYIGYDLFGKDVIWYVGVSAFLNFFTNFWIARWLGREALMKFLGKRLVKRIDQLSQDYGLTTLFFLRVFQGGIHDLISYSAGFTNLNFHRYLIVSTIGLFPGLLIWYVTALLYPSTIEFFFASTIISVVMSVVFIGGSIGIATLQKIRSKKCTSSQ